MLSLAQIITNTILIGSIYTLISLGFFVIYKSLGIINLAHGEFILIGSYAAWFINQELGIDPLYALVIVIPLMLVLGYVLSWVYLSQRISRNPIFAMLITWALAMMMRSMFRIVFTTVTRTVDTSFESSLKIGIFILPSLRTFIMVVVGILIVSLTLIFQRTRFGRQIRCVSQNITAAQMLGMNITRIQISALLLGLVLIGFAGVLISPVYALSPVLGQWLTIKCLAVVLLARDGGFVLIWISGLILAFAETMIATFVPVYGTNLNAIAAFIVILIALVWNKRFRQLLRVRYARFTS